MTSKTERPVVPLQIRPRGPGLGLVAAGEVDLLEVAARGQLPCRVLADTGDQHTLPGASAIRYSRNWI